MIGSIVLSENENFIIRMLNLLLPITIPTVKLRLLHSKNSLRLQIEPVLLRPLLLHVQGVRTAHPLRSHSRTDKKSRGCSDEEGPEGGTVEGGGGTVGALYPKVR